MSWQANLLCHDMSLNKATNVESPLPISGPVSSLDAETVLRGYYHVVFALLRGSPQRPGLPLELVIYVCRLACFSQPNPSKESSAHRIIPGLDMPPKNYRRPPVPYTILQSGPLTKPHGGGSGIDRLEILVKRIFYDQKVRTSAIFVFVF